MKKVTLALLSASLLAGALFAEGNTHAGNHMHNGKMMNHSTSQNMTDGQMEKMKEFHKECLSKLNSNSPKTLSNLSAVQKQHLELLHEDIDRGG